MISDSDPLNTGKFSMFFLKPKKSLDVHTVAKRLVSRKGILEVMITEGTYGFIVKTSENCHYSLFNDISDGYGKITCHYQYKNNGRKVK